MPKNDEPPAAANAELSLRRAFMFPLFLGPNAEAHYAGKGIKLDSKDSPILWFKPKGAKTYRVIYADLTVKDSDAAPIVPGATPIGGAPPAPK